MKKPSRYPTLLVLATSFGIPFFAAAQLSYGGSVNQVWVSYYKDLIIWFVNSVLVPVLIAIAFITFLWGVYKYFIYEDNEREEGKKFVLYGIIGFVIIVSVWGLVNMVKNTLIPSSAGDVRPAYPTLLRP